MGSLMRQLFGRPWIPFLMGGVLIAIYAVLAPDGKLPDIPAWETVAWHVARDLGIAFIVGAIIAGGIERVAREERHSDVKAHISDVHQGVIQSLVKRDFPQTYIDFFLNSLRNEALFQRNTKLEVRIRRPSPENGDETGLPDGKLIVEYEYMFDIENVTDDDFPYTGTLFVEKDWDWDRCEAIKKCVGVTYWKFGDKMLSQAEIQIAREKLRDEKYHLWYEFPIKHTMPKKSIIPFRASFKTVVARRDTTTWTCIRPCDSIEILVKHPEGLELAVNPKHPSQRDVTPPTSSGGETFINTKIAEPMFAYTVVEMSWRELDDAHNAKV